jgi:hypothetical protein
MFFIIFNISEKIYIDFEKVSPGSIPNSIGTVQDLDNGLKVLKYQPELRYNWSLLTLFFQIFAIVVIFYNENNFFYQYYL